MRLDEIIAKPLKYEDAVLNKLLKIYEKYGKEKTFITYTRLDRLEINPNTEYNTPSGIYSYPLYYSLRNNLLSIPFAYGMPFVQAFVIDIPEDNILRISTDILTEGMTDRIINAIDNIVGNQNHHNHEIKTNFGLYMYVQNCVDKSSTKIYKKSEFAKIQTEIFKYAGIHAIIDPGFGAIHINEPTQAVFFYIEDLAVAGTFKNTATSDLYTHHELSHKNNKGSFNERLDAAIYVGKRDEDLEKLPIPKKTSPTKLTKYATEVSHKRWPEAEPFILTKPNLAYLYASKAIKGRWPEAEPVIITDPKCAWTYAYGWPAAESTIKRDRTWWKNYMIYVVRD
jgi:hypothetical protein